MASPASSKTNPADAPSSKKLPPPATAPGPSSFFEALPSPRRLLLVPAAHAALERLMARTLPDHFAAFPAIKPFDLIVGDGHFHPAAAHDPRDSKGTKYATGHVYLPNLRTQAMRYPDLCDKIGRLKEHDLRLLKRHGYDALLPKAIKSLFVRTAPSSNSPNGKKAKTLKVLFPDTAELLWQPKTELVLALFIF